MTNTQLRGVVYRALKAMMVDTERCIIRKKIMDEVEVNIA